MPKGVFKIETPVFHYPEFPDNGITGWYIPHVAVDVDPGGPSLTRQDFAEECDINTIMAKYEHTGVLPAVNDRQAYYADFTTMPTDLAGAMKLMADASDAFMSLPARVRREFDNDPIAFSDYAADPDNLDQMREWGLAPPKKEAPTPGASEPPPAASAASPAAPAAAPPASPDAKAAHSSS